MGKYAVLVGINYVKNPEAALAGCCNDVRIMKRIALSKGFKEENIKLIIDDDDEYPSPSGAEVKKALQWLCTERSENDVIFFHFSGHGTQIPCDGDDYEEDGLDVAIVLEQMFLLADDDLKMYFSQLPKKCRVTCVFDCCHSGSMLDGELVVIDGDKNGDVRDREYDDSESDDYGEEEDDYEYEGSDSGDGYWESSSSSSSSSGDGDSMSQSRSLSIGTIAQILGEKLGHGVDATGGGVKGALATLFGGSSSKLAMGYSVGKLSGEKNALSKLKLSEFCSSFFGGGSDSDDGKDEYEKLDGVLESGSLESGPGFKIPSCSTKDVAVLITGCQSHETSADVTPPGGGGSYGALTKTLNEVYKQNRTISHYDLVSQIRERLSEQGFSQNPCLECCGKKAKRAFIC